jgi:hypothetical protein
MYENTAHRDFVKTETAYRLERVRDGLAARRGRRTRTRARRHEADGLVWTSIR